MDCWLGHGRLRYLSDFKDIELYDYESTSSSQDFLRQKTDWKSWMYYLERI